MRRTVGVAAGTIVLGLALFLGGALSPRGSDPVEANSAAVPGGLPDVRIDAGDVDATISALQARVSKGGPSRAAHQAALAAALLQKARTEAQPAFYDQAEDALEASFDTQADGNFEAALGSALLAGARHDFRGQLEWAKKAAEINPYNSQALGVAGDAYLELGHTRQGFAAYQRAVDLRPDLASLTRVSYAAQAQGETGAAIEAMTRALDYAGASKPAAAWVHWQIGELYIGASRFDRAERHLSAALELVPDYPPARESVAHVTAARGDIAGATEMLRDLVTDYPLPGNHTFLGELHLLRGEGDLAAAAFAEADRRLQLYADHGVRPDVDFVTFWADRGIRLETTLIEARKMYSERKTAAVSDALAWALHANGRFRQADRYAREAMRRSEIGGGDAGITYHAAVIAREIGDRERSDALLVRALELDPSWSILESHRARRALRASR